MLRLVVAPSDRAVLHDAIASRFDDMLRLGLIEEVSRLRADPKLTRASTSMRAVGYRQVWAHLDGEFDRNTLREKGIIATRQLARRQLTWLRGLTDASWVDTLTPTLSDALSTQVERFLLAHRR